MTSGGAYTSSRRTPQALLGWTKVTSKPEAPFLMPPTIFTPLSKGLLMKISLTFKVLNTFRKVIDPETDVIQGRDVHFR